MNNNISKLTFAFSLLLLLISNISFGQEFTHQDSLRGSIGPGRLKWNVLHYDITVKPDIILHSIEGINTITILDSGANTIQLDLQEPMQIDSIKCNNRQLNFSREGNVFWVEMQHVFQETNFQIKYLSVYFHGKPREAKNAPWDGGWVWSKDKLGNPWVSAACQGLGASVWYPCKDHQADEPENGAALNIIVPDSLQAVGNGKLDTVIALEGHLSKYCWQVKSPINNYDIIPYIGKYEHFDEKYQGLKGKLDMDYWVLSYNLEKARNQFKDAPRMMKALEYWFGPYPFYDDGYKLVEAPYLGMEHQSDVAYGNGYLNGYLGHDRSATGWGMKWDFIIVHESGHEWFGNNITSKDIADMWIHESFTNYSEVLFTEFYYGKKAADEYVIGLRKNISNDVPIIGKYGINKEGSGDMYDKGSNMIHTIRQVINNDKKFKNILNGLSKDFYHQTVTTSQIENYMSIQSGIDLSKIFDQYLRTTKIPQFTYQFKSGRFYYKWENVVPGFDMPVKMTLGNKKEKWVYPTTIFKSKRMKLSDRNFKLNSAFYVNTSSIN